MMSRVGLARGAVKTVLEVVAAIAAATALVGLLDRIAPITGLTVIYLLAVLWVAIRRGELPAVTTAVGSVLTMNFLFIEPKYRFTIAHSENFVALTVLLIAALVVGRLASSARSRAAESQVRAAIADAREREAQLLANSARLMLAGGRVEDSLDEISEQLSQAVGAPARIALAATPPSRPGERARRLEATTQPAWLVVSATGDAEAVERIADPLGRLLQVGLAHREMAEREVEAEATRRAEGAKTAVLHTVSHDLRSPLTAMLTATSGLRSADLQPDDRAELLTVLEVEGQRLSRLVADLLDLSRIEAGAAQPQAEWSDVRDVIGGAVEQVQAAHGPHPIEIELPAELPLVRTDSVQLERVFFNLIENAVKFSPPDTPVTVSGAATAGSVTVRVKDRGRGIPASKRQQVFEPFFKGRGAGAGSGLGLAISRGFVEANGGRLTLQTRRGAGTAFAVTLPVPAGVPTPA